MEKQIQEKVDMGTVYEVSYILLPSLAESEIPAKVGSMKDLITQAGGAVVSFEDPVLIDLAYPMTRVTPTSRVKVSSGYFGWVKFELSQEEVGKIKNKLDNDGEVVRYLIVKTVKENTLLNGKMNLAREAREVCRVAQKKIQTYSSLSKRTFIYKFSHVNSISHKSLNSYKR
jgi:ribosomal protein S6